jgi:hypothetical protein
VKVYPTLAVVVLEVLRAKERKVTGLESPKAPLAVGQLPEEFFLLPGALALAYCHGATLSVFDGVALPSVRGAGFFVEEVCLFYRDGFADGRCRAAHKAFEDHAFFPVVDGKRSFFVVVSGASSYPTLALFAYSRKLGKDFVCSHTAPPFVEMKK